MTYGIRFVDRAAYCLSPDNQGGSGDAPPPVQVVSDADAPTDAMSYQAAAELLTKSRNKGQTDAPKAPAQRPAQSDAKTTAPVTEDADLFDDEETDGAPSGDEEIDEADEPEQDGLEPTPDRTPPPKSWSEADHAAWNELTPAAQQKWLARERQMKSGYDKQLSKIQAEQKAWNEAKAAEETQLTHMRQHLDAALQNTQSGIINRLKTEFADVDPRNPASLAQLAAADPGRKVLFDELWRQLGAIGHQAKQQEQAKAAETEAEYEKFRTARTSRLVELDDGLSDPIRQKDFEEKLVGYLHQGQKITPDRINMYSAEELIMADKARRYDAAMEARKAKRTAPTGGPKPVLRSGQPREGGASEKIAALEKRARKTGDIKDVMALQRARRAG